MRAPRKGDRVRIHRDRPARGSWARYAGRTGTVVTVNLGEYGVSFTNKDNQVDSWFLRDEVVILNADTDRSVQVG